MRKVFLIFIGFFTGLLICIAALLKYYDWNRLRPWIAATTEKTIGRTLNVGNINIDWSWSPRLRLDAVTLEEGPKSKRADFLSADHVEVSLAVLSLLEGKIEIPTLQITGAKIHLMKREDGTQNLDFVGRKSTEPKSATRRSRLILREAHLQNIEVQYSDFMSGSVFRLVIEEATSIHVSGSSMMSLLLSGRAEVKTSTANDTVSRALALSGTMNPSPLKIQLAGQLGEVALGVDLLSAQDKADGFDLNLFSSSPSVSPLLRDLGLNVGNIPPYRMSAHIRGGEGVWKIAPVEIKVGETDFTGDINLDTRDHLKIASSLSSSWVRFDDLLPFFGVKGPKVASKGSKGATAPGGIQSGKDDRLFSRQPMHLEILRRLDLDLNYRFKRVTAVNPAVDLIEDGTLDLKLDKGRVRLENLSVNIAGGRLAVKGDLNVDTDVPSVKLEGTISRLDVGRLVDAYAEEFQETYNKSGPVAKAVKKQVRHLSRNTYGFMGGRVALSSSGSSPQLLAQNLNGEFGVAMEDGHISDVMAYLTSLDAGKAWSSYMGGDKGSPVECLILTFDVGKGDAKVDTILMATPVANFRGEGHIDIGREQIDLMLTPYPKKITLDSLRAPLLVKGSLTQPKVGPEPKYLLARIGAAIVLGAFVAPVAAVMPFVEVGLGTQGSCTRHLTEMASLQSKQKPPVTH